MDYDEGISTIEDVRESIIAAIDDLPAQHDGYLRECLEAADRSLNNAHHWLQEARNNDHP